MKKSPDGGPNCTYGQLPWKIEIIKRASIDYPELKKENYLYDFYHNNLKKNKGVAAVYLNGIEVGKLNFEIETQVDTDPNWNIVEETLKKVVSVKFIKREETEINEDIQLQKKEEAEAQKTKEERDARRGKENEKANGKIYQTE